MRHLYAEQVFIDKNGQIFVQFIFLFRPAVRALPSKQMFEHMLKRHDVLFVYVGGESPLKVSTVYFTHT